MISRHSIFAGVAAIAVLASAVSFAADGKAQISFKTEIAYPENVTWSAKRDAFLVSSVRHGTIGIVSPKGNYTTFITDEKLISTVGLLVDDKRNALWVANSDPGAGDRTSTATEGKLAGVAKYDATTGGRIVYYDLGSLSEGARRKHSSTWESFLTI
ncbi:hypothetical protein [Bradyrhizobium sp. McL0616]|uniref:hypothetical protein n=1 Tax=Bradyrhizobium sp. McL0616 TaxID=3415674 RepID=UPI003CEA5B22